MCSPGRDGSPSNVLFPIQPLKTRRVWHSGRAFTNKRTQLTRQSSENKKKNKQCSAIKCTLCVKKMGVPSGFALRTRSGGSLWLKLVIGNGVLEWELVIGAKVWMMQRPCFTITFDKFCCIVQTCDHLLGRFTRIPFRKRGVDYNTRMDDTTKCIECCRAHSRRIHYAIGTRLCVGFERLTDATRFQTTYASVTNCSTRQVWSPIPKCYHIYKFPNVLFNYCTRVIHSQLCWN